MAAMASYRTTNYADVIPERHSVRPLITSRHKKAHTTSIGNTWSSIFAWFQDLCFEKETPTILSIIQKSQSQNNHIGDFYALRLGFISIRLVVKYQVRFSMYSDHCSASCCVAVIFNSTYTIRIGCLNSNGRDAWFKANKILVDA